MERTKSCPSFKIIILVLLIGCNKNISSNQESVTIKKDFVSCQCTISNETGADRGYIKAIIDGTPVCFDQLPAYMGDTFPNMLKYGLIGNLYYDNLYMIRNSPNGDWQAAIFLENTHALTKTYPYQLPRANPEVCEIGELQINNLQPNSNLNYAASFYGGGLNLTAMSFQNNVFEGDFGGRLVTRNGKNIFISDGHFRIKLKVFKSDL